MPYVFKNRSNFAQQQQPAVVPHSWEQKVVNREIEWKLGFEGLSYRVTGERVNVGESIVKPECRRTVLFEGLKKGIYKPDNDLLQTLADAWAATILLADGEAYRGCNGATETPDTPQTMTGSDGPYPYF